MADWQQIKNLAEADGWHSLYAAGHPSTTVASISDLLGNENALVQATNQPQLVTVSNGGKGFKALRFDGINDVMSTTGFPTGDQPFTLVLVGKKATGETDRNGLLFWGAAATRNGVDIGQIATNQLGATLAGAADISDTPATAVDGSFIIQTLTYESQEYEYFENGVSVGTFSDSSPLNITDAFGIGSRVGPGDYGSGDIVDVLVATSVIASTPLGRMHDLLATLRGVG